MPRRNLPTRAPARPRAPTPKPIPTPAPYVPPVTVNLALLLVVHCERGGIGTKTHDGTPRIDWSRDREGFMRISDLWLDYGAKLAVVGARCSFMAPASWWESVRYYRSSWALDMVSMGHEVGLHERGGYESYEAARVALSYVLGYEAPRIASGVLQSEVDGFPSGWVFTGMSFAPGHADGGSLAGMHISGIWGIDNAEGWEGPGERYTVIGYGSGSTSKADRMADDLPRLGGIQTYDGDNPSTVVSYAIHGMMADAQGIETEALGISKDDTPALILTILTNAMSVEGVQAATFKSVLASWDGKPWKVRTAGKDSGENHWVGVGGGTQT